MTTSDQITLKALSSMAEITPQDWDACACPEVTQDGDRALDPFTTYRFLRGLEASGSVGAGSGWEPHPLIAEQAGKVIGVLPLYAKGHSQGEYIFDHNWAHAYEQAGGRYYPKLQVAVPFTPATGRRILARPGYEDVAIPALLDGAIQMAEQNKLSSLHITFCTETEADVLESAGLHPRIGQQFHWENDAYPDFEGFMATLSSRKRKAIRKERRTAQNFGGQIICLTGDQIEPEHWDAFWQFYQDTGARKWGTPYLTRRFFDLVQEQMRDDVLLILARRNGQWVAGALNFIGRETLYGRYWGALEHHSCLHFELCYYQAIEAAIERGMTRVEAGAQGEHKLARGYMPTPVYSAHWIADPRFEQAISDYLTAERRAIGEDIEILTSYGPFRKTQMEEQE